MRIILPTVWSSFCTVKMAAFGTFVSFSIIILQTCHHWVNGCTDGDIQGVITYFFSPSKRRNDSKAGGAFIARTAPTVHYNNTIADKTHKQ
jgi:hypothetical protein